MAKTPAITGSIEGPFMVVDKDGSGTPNHGDSIKFRVSSTSQLFVNVLAHQGEQLVMNSWAPAFPGGADPDYGLYSPIWQEGEADCIANLVSVDKQGKYHTVASLEFAVGA